MKLLPILTSLFTVLVSLSAAAVWTGELSPSDIPDEAKDIKTLLFSSTSSGQTNQGDLLLYSLNVFTNQLSPEERRLYIKYYFPNVLEDLYLVFREDNIYPGVLDDFVMAIDFQAEITHDDYNNFADLLVGRKESLGFIKYLLDNNYIDLSMVSELIKENLSKMVFKYKIKEYTDVYLDELIEHGFSGGDFATINSFTSDNKLVLGDQLLSESFVSHCLDDSAQVSYSSSISKITRLLKKSLTEAQRGDHFHVIASSDSKSLCEYYFEFSYKVDEKGGLYIQSLFGNIDYRPLDERKEFSQAELLKLSGLKQLIEHQPPGGKGALVSH